MLDLWLRRGRKSPAGMNLDTHTHTDTNKLIRCKNKLLHCSCVNYLLNLAEILFSINSPCGVEDPSELQYLPEGQGVHTDRESAPVRLL